MECDDDNDVDLVLHIVDQKDLFKQKLILNQVFRLRLHHQWRRWLTRRDENLELDLIVEGGQFGKQRNFMQSSQKGNTTMHADCATETAARAKSLQQVTAFWNEKAALKERIVEWTRRLAEKPLAWERSFAKKRPLENVVAAKENLTQQIKQLSSIVVDVKGVTENSNEAVGKLNFMIKTDEKLGNDVANKNYALLSPSK